MLAEQVAEKERQKKQEEERRKQEEDRENERIRREQAAEEARLEARRQEEEAKKRALLEENERVARQRQEDDEPPGPLPRKPLGRRTMREATQDQGFVQGRGTRSDLFGLPEAQPVPFNASPSSSPLPWEVGQVGTLPAPAQQSFGVSAAPASSPPVSDMLQGLMHQQQELYRHQQEALARLQEEADRLRQEKECAKQDLLDMKARQLEEKEKDVKKLQRKLQRQMLLQSGNAPGQAPLHSMLPSVSSTPVEGMSGMRGPAGEPWGGFYSKYESADDTPAGEAHAASASEWEPGYPTDEELNQLRQDMQEPHAARRMSAVPSDPHAWPVAPVPWLQPAEANDPAKDVGFPHIISSAPEAPQPASVASVGEASLFEDSWGKPLENTAQLDERLGNTESLARNMGDDAEGPQLEGTLVGESKFVQADSQGATLGATWIGAEGTEDKLKASVSLHKNLTLNAQGFESQPVVPEERPLDEKDALGTDGFADFSLPKEIKESQSEDPTDPLSLLQGAVNAIREARAEVASAADTASSFAAPSDQAPFSGREAAPAESWEGMLRHFGAEEAVQPSTSKPSKTGRPPRRARQKEAEPDSDETVRIGKSDSGGYPGIQESLPLDLASSGQPDSLDFLQGFGGLGAASSTMGTTSLDGLGTQRPIAKDDFAAFAAATPEDFDAFLSRLRAQTGPADKSQTKPSPSDGRDTARGRQPVAGVSAKDRAKFGSPTLRAAAGSLLNHDHRPTSGQSQLSGISGGRPGSGGSAGSLNSAGGVASLRDLRQQRRKPKTTEDYAARDLPAGAALPDTGPGTSLHATVPASVPREPSTLQSLREEYRVVGD